MTPPSRDTTVYVALGSSQGDRQQYLDQAAARLDALDTHRRARGSRIYDTAPVGEVARQRFLNAVVRLTTRLEPLALLAEMQRIEQRLGRERRARWADRVIDLDIVLWEDRHLDLPGLTIPHPEMHRRHFVLAPLADLDPAAMHPTLKRSVASLLAALPAPEGDTHLHRGTPAWPGWMATTSVGANLELPHGHHLPRS